MKTTLGDKLGYRFERFLNKGGSSIFKSLLIVFISGFLFIVLIRYILLLIFPELDYLGDFWDHMWVTFLQMTAPGNMNQDNSSPTWLKITTILAGFSGVIILSMLIASITSALNSVLYNFRKGRGKVIEKDHTVILGWNERVVDILREIIIANESEKRGVVVILGDSDKEGMDDMIAKRLPDTKTTEVITTSGNSSNINELSRINITKAKSVILLANCTENSPVSLQQQSDIQAIKTIMAINACQNGKSEIPIIAETFTEEKREIIKSFNDENLIAINSWEIMGKLLTQTSLTSGLQLVYNEILSFDGCEVYFYKAKWTETNFYNLAYHFKDGIPLGIYNDDEGLILRPTAERPLTKDDQIVILAEDDSTIDYSHSRLYTPIKQQIPDRRLEPSKTSTLLMGWHNVGDIYINEANDYLKEGSRFDIMLHNPPKQVIDDVAYLKKEYPNFEINLIDKNPLKIEDLKSLSPDTYDNLIILSQDMIENDSDRVDSDTLIILLLLRQVMDNENGNKVITQVLNSDNQELINQTSVDDFIISNRLITMILAQLSEEPRIKHLYIDIFSEEGSEIYVKPASLYYETFPQKVRFCDLMGIANLRDEVCLGIRKGNEVKEMNKNFGIKLNIKKDKQITLEENDFLVVLSEDEL